MQTISDFRDVVRDGLQELQSRGRSNLQSRFEGTINCQWPITRCADKLSQTGKNEIDINGLSSCMDPDSARVTGLGEARLSDFTCVIGKSGTPTASQKHIETLEGQKEALDAERRTRERQADFLANYGDTLAAQHVQPEQALAFADSFLKQRMRDMEALKTVQNRISALDKEIAETREQQQKRKGSAHGQAHVVVTTTAEGPVQLKLTYSEPPSLLVNICLLCDLL